MGNHTNIQWCDSTVSPTTGCDGCELFIPGVGGPCYAGALHEGRLAKSLPDLYAPTFTEVRLAPGRMKRAAGWSDLRGVVRPGKPWIPPETPRLIFVDDMSDILSAAVPFDYLKAELIDAATSIKGSRHVWMVLTKRPGRLNEFATRLFESFGIAWPENIWCGTSVTGRASLKRAEALAAHPASVKFLSAEPLRERIDLSPWLAREFWDFGSDDDRPPFAQVIVGGESRQGGWEPYPFELAWAREIIALCREAGVSCFVKQLGSRPDPPEWWDERTKPHTRRLIRDSHGGDWGEWPADLRVRELPAAGRGQEVGP